MLPTMLPSLQRLCRRRSAKEHRDEPSQRWPPLLWAPWRSGQTGPRRCRRRRRRTLGMRRAGPKPPASLPNGWRRFELRVVLNDYEKKERRREAKQAAQPERPFPPPGDHPDEPTRGTGTAGLCAELREAHAAVPAPVPDRPSGCSPPSAPVGPQAVQRPSLGAASFDIDSQVSGIRSAHTMSKVPTSVSASSCHTLRAAAPRDGSVASPAGRHRAGPYPAHHDKGYGYGSR